MGARWRRSGAGGHHPLRAGLAGRHRLRPAPGAGREVSAGDSFGEVESTKSVSEIYAPISGTVVGRNDKLVDEPETINADPYGEGWLVEIDPSDPAALDGLLTAAAYRELTEG